MKLKRLPKPAKVAATHALSELEYSIRNIAKILGIGKVSVQRYLKEETDETWTQFGHSIKKIAMVKEEEAAAEALSLIKEKMPRAQFRDLVGFYKIIRELRRPAVPSVAQQFIGVEEVKLTNEQLERIIGD